MHIEKVSAERFSWRRRWKLQFWIADKCFIIQLFYINNIISFLHNYMMNSTFEYLLVEVMNDLDMFNKIYELEWKKGTYVFILVKKRWLDKSLLIIKICITICKWLESKKSWLKHRLNIHGLMPMILLRLEKLV